MVASPIYAKVCLLSGKGGTIIFWAGPMGQSAFKGRVYSWCDAKVSSQLLSYFPVKPFVNEDVNEGVGSGDVIDFVILRIKHLLVSRRCGVSDSECQEESY